jgi:hypothetical protein
MTDWTLDEDGLGADFAEVTDERDELVALIKFRPDQQANAKLIAAAPGLLELARKYASECAECLGGKDSDSSACEACADIRAVIDRAAGS